MSATTVLSYSAIPELLVGYKRLYGCPSDSVSSCSNTWESDSTSQSSSSASPPHQDPLDNNLPPLKETSLSAMYNRYNSPGQSLPMPIEPPISSPPKRRRMGPTSYQYPMNGGNMFMNLPPPQYQGLPLAPPGPPPKHNSQSYPFSLPPLRQQHQQNSYPQNQGPSQSSYPYADSYPIPIPHLGSEGPSLSSKARSGSSSSSKNNYFNNMMLPPTSSKVADQRYPCWEPGCGNKYRTPEQLQKHKAKSHSRPRPYHCDKCHRSFAERGNLKKHEKSVHDGKRDKKCPYPGCGKMFSFNDGLSRHIRNVHQQLRPYSCPCGKSFKQLSHLKKHTNARICSGGL